MKKMMKKLIAMAAALVMIVTLLPAMGVNANSTGLPTITYSDDGETVKQGTLNIYKTTGKDENGKTDPLANVGFTVYKIATADKDGNWTIDSAVQSTYSTLEKLLAAANQNGGKNAAATLAKLSLTSVDTEKKTDNNGYTSFNLPIGIYLVEETATPNGYVASSPFLVMIPSPNTADNSDDMPNVDNSSATYWSYDVTAKPKNEETTIIKEIVETETIEGEEVEVGKDSSDASVGDTIEYKITSVSPNYTDEYFKPIASNDPVYIISDTLSSGLTLNTDSISVTINDSTIEETVSDQYYSIDPDPEDGTTFKVTFTTKFMKEYKGATVVIRYNATVNQNAVVGTDANTNEAILDYNTSPDEQVKGDKPNDETKTYTYGLKVTKKAGSEEGDLLSGAKFKLYKVENNAETQVIGLIGMDDQGQLTTGSTGVISFSGLSTGTYRLEEVAAPNGYTLLTDKIEFTINDDNLDGVPEIATNGFAVERTGEGDSVVATGYVTTTVINNKGFTLPSTGGMGTYLFTIGGIVIMAGAAFALIAMKKRA